MSDAPAEHLLTFNINSKIFQHIIVLWLKIRQYVFYFIFNLWDICIVFPIGKYLESPSFGRICSVDSDYCIRCWNRIHSIVHDWFRLLVFWSAVTVTSWSVWLSFSRSSEFIEKRFRALIYAVTRKDFPCYDIRLLTNVAILIFSMTNLASLIII